MDALWWGLETWGVGWRWIRRREWRVSCSVVSLFAQFVIYCRIAPLLLSIYSSMFFRWFGLETRGGEWQRKQAAIRWRDRKTRSNVDGMKKWDVWERGINYILSNTELWRVWWAKIIYCTVRMINDATQPDRDTTTDCQVSRFVMKSFPFAF